ncbi:MAG TPA: hypothetical protein VKT82_24380 [Ktedonobacterales bacterium]|nr:hypothetical protein [Ktedonobacterales bacterium]
MRFLPRRGGPRVHARQPVPPSRRSRLRWLRSPWLWWGLLVLLGLLLLPAPLAHAAPLSLAAPTGLRPLFVTVPFSPALPHGAQVPADDCGVTNLTSCFNSWITSFLQNPVESWWKQQVDTFQTYGFIFKTPAPLTYDAPPVKEMYTFALAVVGALLVILLAVSGLNYMLGRSTSWSETLPQIILCGLMAFAFQPFIAMFIQLGNDFIDGMQAAVLVKPSFPGYGIGANAIMDILAAVVELAADILLALEALARLALLDLLIALAPLGIMCYALPQSRAWGRMWAEAFVATILIQPIQTTLVMLGAKMIALVAGFLTVPSLPPTVQVLVGLASISLALKVPSLLLGRATHVVTDFHNESVKLLAVFAGG